MEKILIFLSLFSIALFSGCKNIELKKSLIQHVHQHFRYYAKGPDTYQIKKCTVIEYEGYAPMIHKHLNLIKEEYPETGNPHLGECQLVFNFSDHPLEGTKSNLTYQEFFLYIPSSQTWTFLAREDPPA